MTKEIGMFDGVKTVRAEETANGRRFVTDEQTLAELEFAEACEELVEAEREFAEWDSKAGKRWAHPDSGWTVRGLLPVRRAKSKVQLGFRLAAH